MDEKEQVAKLGLRTGVGLPLTFDGGLARAQQRCGQQQQQHLREREAGAATPAEGPASGAGGPWAALLGRRTVRGRRAVVAPASTRRAASPHVTSRRVPAGAAAGAHRGSARGSRLADRSATGVPGRRVSATLRQPAGRRGGQPPWPAPRMRRGARRPQPARRRRLQCGRGPGRRLDAASRQTPLPPQEPCVV
ncbi:circumsporozoite protein-like [Schistocerca piceifrons]|uniref:circumsporozoite protein-like n=1 Tax=Schistocerca piceifrons TaxID=274613 RepID=UPI001F5EC00F|nr:circumsporozoite protein-like [Schistocerca piceifrons]